MHSWMIQHHRTNKNRPATGPSVPLRRRGLLHSSRRPSHGGHARGRLSGAAPSIGSCGFKMDPVDGCEILRNPTR